MENASAAFLAAVRTVMGPIRRALGTVDPNPLSSAKQLQCEGYMRRSFFHAGSYIRTTSPLPLP